MELKGKRIEYQMVILKEMDFRIWLRDFKNIADSTDGVDDLIGKALVNLIPQTAGQHIHDVGLRIEVIVPDLIKDHGLGDHLPGIAHQIFEQAELPGREFDLRAGSGDLAAEKIKHKIPGGQAA
jgi:hypothetical protein